MRISDEELEAFCDDRIFKSYPNMSFMRLAFDLRDLRKLARPFAGWNNCIQSDNEFRWFKVTAQEFDALKTHLKAKP